MRWGTPATILAIVGLTAGVEIAAYHGHPVPSIADGIVGATLLICGVLAWRLRSARAVGALMLLTGGAWLLGTLLPAALLLHRGPLVHLHISYPTGRLRRPLAIVTVAVAYVTAIVEPWARNDWLTMAVAVLIAAAAVDVFVRTSGPARKAGRPALAAALAFAGVLALGAIDRLAGWGAGLAMLLLYDAVVAAVAVVLSLDLRFGRWVDATVADLVIGLGGEASASLQAQLRRAMGDPSVVVGYWAPEIGSYVDDAGAPLRLPTDQRTRVVTYVEDNGAPLAALVHDPAVARDPELLTAVSAAARLAVTNVRLRAGIRDRATRLAASRRRIVEAADRQRRDLETELAAGTVDRLAEVARLLDELRRRRRRRDQSRTRRRSYRAGGFRSWCAAGRVDGRWAGRGVAAARRSVAGAGGAHRADRQSTSGGGGLRVLRLRGGVDQCHQARVGNPGRDRRQPAGRPGQNQHHR